MKEEQNNWSRLSYAICTDSRLTLSAKVVYTVLHDYMREDGSNEAVISVRRIARLIGESIATVNRAIKVLKETGYIIKVWVEDRIYPHYQITPILPPKKRGNKAVQQEEYQQYSRPKTQHEEPVKQKCDEEIIHHEEIETDPIQEHESSFLERLSASLKEKGMSLPEPVSEPETMATSAASMSEPQPSMSEPQPKSEVKAKQKFNYKQTKKENDTITKEKVNAIIEEVKETESVPYEKACAYVAVLLDIVNKQQPVHPMPYLKALVKKRAYLPKEEPEWQPWYKRKKQNKGDIIDNNYDAKKYEILVNNV